MISQADRLARSTVSLLLALALAMVVGGSGAPPAHAATKTVTKPATVVFAHAAKPGKPGKPGNCSAVIFVQWLV